MSNPTHTATAEQPSFETSLSRIEAIVHELEEGKTGLADSLARYEEAVRLLKQCYGLLENAERRIELLVGFDAAGNVVTEPFDDTATADRAPDSSPRSRRRAEPSSKAPPVSPLAPSGDISRDEAPGGLF
jgi:exodeoxyribonuclease VII small subunit